MIELLRAHTEEELLDLYKEKGYPENLYDTFKKRYGILYTEFYNDVTEGVDEKELEEELDENDWPRNDAFLYATKYMDKFAEQIKVGHGEEWAHQFAKSVEDEEEKSIYEAYQAIYSQNEELARKELLLHCKSLGEGVVFEERYMRIYKMGEGWKNPREEAQEYARILKQQIAVGKSEVYARKYAELVSDGQLSQKYCEKYAYAYDKAVSGGKDEMYAGLFADMYGEGYANYGEREEKDIPELWEHQIFAYMNAWDYARRHALSDTFIKIYEKEYMNTVYSDEPEQIPWDKLEEFVLKMALDKFKQ